MHAAFFQLASLLTTFQLNMLITSYFLQHISRFTHRNSLAQIKLIFLNITNY
jgi:hypothetical protein